MVTIMIKNKKQTIFFIVVTMAMGLMIWYGATSHIDFGMYHQEGVTFPSGRVIEVVDDQTGFNEVGARMGRQELLVRLTSGPRRGDIVEVQNMLFPIEQAVYAQTGDRIVIYFEQMPGAPDYQYFARVQSHHRAPAIYIIILMFFGLLALVFGKTGLKSAFSLIFTFVVIIFLLLPLIVRGAPPALLTIALSVCIVVVSLIAIMGFEKKTYVSIAGTIIGIACYCLFYLMIGAALRITGFNIQQIDTLIVIGFSLRLDELLFCAILIASLGALMDVSVSLASVIAELSETNPKSDVKSLFNSGMKIGRDIIASSSNTLILAFTGTFLITLIFFRTHNFQYNMVMNRVDIGIEVLRAISASAAMIVCAPATALIGSRMYASLKGKKT